MAFNRASVAELREVAARNRTDDVICCMCGEPATANWVQLVSADRRMDVLTCGWRCAASYTALLGFGREDPEDD